MATFMHNRHWIIQPDTNKSTNQMLLLSNVKRNHTLKISGVQNKNIIVTNKLCHVLIERSRNISLSLVGGCLAGVEINRCINIKLSLRGNCKTVQVDNSSNVSINASGEIAHDTTIIHANSAGVSLYKHSTTDRNQPVSQKFELSTSMVCQKYTYLNSESKMRTKLADDHRNGGYLILNRSE
mmetsp:Transcript_16599/g.24755  ORF Transcript_16599/g.24755 Transcript_16599/m.24755 type:complete len:182 (+) Transcript_16599:764-1309(+)